MGLQADGYGILKLPKYTISAELMEKFYSWAEEGSLTCRNKNCWGYRHPFKLSLKRDQLLASRTPFSQNPETVLSAEGSFKEQLKVRPQNDQKQGLNNLVKRQNMPQLLNIGRYKRNIRNNQEQIKSVETQNHAHNQPRWKV